MTTKELQEYANEMDKKHNIHYFTVDAHKVKDKRIEEASALKLSLISHLKEEVDVIVDFCARTRFYQYPYTWFDVNIPRFNLLVKLCSSKEEQDTAYCIFKYRPIVLVPCDTDTLDDVLQMIQNKLIKMADIENRKQKGGKK